MKITKSQIREIIRQEIIEVIKKVGNEYAVYPKKGGKRLGTHKTKDKALAQLKAIEASKHARTGKELDEVDIKKSIVSLKKDYPGSKVYQAQGDGSSVKAQQTNRTWEDGAPMTNKFGPKKTSKVPRGKFWVLDTKKFWYYELKDVWYAIKKSEYGTPPGMEF